MGVGQMHKTRDFVPCGFDRTKPGPVDQRLARPESEPAVAGGIDPGRPQGRTGGRLTV